MVLNFDTVVMAFHWIDVCCLCTDMLLCSLVSRPVNFWLLFGSHSMRHVCYVCPGVMLWPQPSVIQAIASSGLLWSLTNQTALEDLLSAAMAQIESTIKNLLTAPSPRNSSVCADLKFIFLSCSTSGRYWLNNSQEPYSTWHLSHILLWCWRMDGKS